MNAPRYDVLAIGNALVDVLAPVDDAFLAAHDVTKGAMTLVDAERAEALYDAMPPATEVSGGSAANTMVGVTSLGGTAAFIGKVRDDQLGEVYTHDLRAAGVAFAVPPAPEGLPTGRSLILVTPDGERSMSTLLGISSDLGPDLVDEVLVADAAVTYLEGYLWDQDAAKEAYRRASALAHAAGRTVALSLSDSFCVDRHRDSFLSLLADGHVDLLFANADEVKALYEVATVAEALDRVAALGIEAAVTRGAAGSVVLHEDGNREAVPASTVEHVIDTTGAGDLFAAGYLWARARGSAPAECARVGGIAAAECITHFGPRPLVTLSTLL